jgi:hypothetical protein
MSTDKISEILIAIDTEYTYKNGKFYKNDAPRTVLMDQDIEDAIVLKAHKTKCQLTDVQISDLIAKFKEVKNRPTIVTNPDEALSINGNYTRLSLYGVEQLPNDVERDILKSIYFSRDPNRVATYFLKNGDEFILIGTEKHLEVKAAFEIAGIFDSAYITWEQKLLEWGNNLVEIYNRDQKEVINYAKDNIPTALMIRFDTYIVTVKEKLADKEVNVAKNIIWDKNNQNPKFYDYIQHVIKMYPTMAITELKKFPEVYGNKGTQAMTIFDKTPYEIDRVPVFNEAWMDMKSKYTENEWKVLAAWIWSVLDAQNKGRQALFIIDYAGFSGKGKLIDFITHTLGDRIAGALVNGSMKNQFGFSKVWDKRLITIGDNKNSMVAKTEWFHNILGGDRIDVEYKGMSSFTAKMNAKLLVCSNNSIEIDPTLLHERSRTIILKPVVNDSLRYKMSAKDSDGKVIYDEQGNAKLLGDNNYLQNLINGGTEFLIFANQCYKELCPSNSEIVLPNDVMNHVYDITPTDTLDMNYYLEKFVILTNDDNDKVSPSNFYKAYKSMAEDNSQIKNDNHFYGNLMSYLAKHHQIEPKKDASLPKRPMMISKVKLKFDFPEGVISKVVPEQTKSDKLVGIE